MAERVVAAASLTPSAAPVSRYVAPVMQEAKQPAITGLAAALSTFNPDLQKYLESVNKENAAAGEAEGEMLGAQIDPSVSLDKNRQDWRNVISEIRKTDPAQADRIAAASPHFRRGVQKARLNRIGMGFDDHLMNLWRSNPEINGQQLHDIDDPAVVQQWISQQAQAYTEQAGIGQVDPLLMHGVYQKRIDAATEAMTSRHTEFRLGRYRQEYMDELAMNAGMAFAGGGTGNSSEEDFMYRMGWSENSNKWGGANSEGYHGKWQFGQARLADFNRATGKNYKLSQFDGSVHGQAIQREVMLWHIRDIDAAIDSSGGLDKGWSRDGLRAVAHLGGKGAMREWVRTGGANGHVADSNGTTLSAYYNKFSGAGASLQELADQAVADGMDPRKVNEAIVLAAQNAARESNNPDAMEALNYVDTGNGPLGNIGWVKKSMLDTEDAINDQIWEQEQRDYTREQRELAERVGEIGADANRILFEDPNADISDLQEQLNDMGKPEAAKQIATLKETLLDRKHNIRTNHEKVSALRLAILNGEMTKEQFSAAIAAGVLNEDFGSSVALALTDDFDRSGGMTDLFDNRYTGIVRSRIGATVGENFGTVGQFGDPLPSKAMANEAEKFFDEEVADWLFSNHDASPAEYRAFLRDLEKEILTSPHWQQTAQDRILTDAPEPVRQPMSTTEAIANERFVAALVVAPSETLAAIANLELDPGTIALISEAAAQKDMTFQQFVETYGPKE